MSSWARRDSAWWGWGELDHPRELKQAGLDLLASEIGELGWIDPGARDAGAVEVPAAGSLPDQLRSAVDPADISTETEDRVRHSVGKSYPDLVRARSGRLEQAPDAVIAPADSESLAKLLRACAETRTAVVPFGGGTSVVGGIDPRREGFERLISLDLARFRMIEIDKLALTARLGAGLRGPEAEQLLNDQGYTLGHFPQSFCYATIGGFAATRSAGQSSSGYGRFDSVVSSLRMQTPTGPLSTPATPHSAAGPSLLELAMGSEGTLGVIEDVTVRIRPLPGVQRYEAWMVADWASGTAACRSLAQEGSLPDVLRLSDPNETRVSLAMSGASPRIRNTLERYLRLRRRDGGCMLITGFDGERESVERRRSIAARVLRSHGAITLGKKPGAAWLKGRFDGPYLRDTLLDRGVMVETLETAHQWSQLPELYEAVGEAITGALSDQGTPPVVLCHISHVYRDGASLYFTFIARQRKEDPIDQWLAVKTAACEAIVAAKGTITHHHAVGRDHAPFLEAEIGERGVAALVAIKHELDPVGVMNPGKLIPR